MTDDSQHRARAATETTRSFAVEASAGTGKTAILIDRILNLVLKEGPQGRPISLRNIAAITFTEKAAGEMKIRLRQRFEESSCRSGVEGTRASVALHDLESAAISTIHAFAVALLKERPVEAGLDPQFTALDDAHAELFFRRVWEAWLDRAIKGRRGPLERALRAGLGLDALRELARNLRFHAGVIEKLNLQSPMTGEEARRRRLDLAAEARKYSRLVVDRKDRLAANLNQIESWLDGSTEYSVFPGRSASAGSRGNWQGGSQTLESVRSFLKRCEDFSTEASSMAAQRLLHEVLLWLAGDFLPEWKGRKRSEGLVDFDDQLLAARDLLARSPAVRHDFQKKFATILVDEFQDTDPIQAEIVLLLSSPDLTETDIEKLQPAPGRLFLVGDPKQSIYRFRGADIENYLNLFDAERIAARGLEHVKLTTNFRSLDSILRVVDALFAGLMKKPEDGRYQPEYLAFGSAARHHEPGLPPVCLLPDPVDQRNQAFPAGDFIAREAWRLAALVRQIRGSEKWLVAERSASQPETRRVPNYGDIAILLPVLSHVDVLEDALRQAEIPYVLEGGKYYYARSEVSSATTVLRAVANPNDRVAVYGSLRSIFFGLSDEDLLRSRMQGITFDYRNEIPAGSRLHHPFRILRELHQQRHERPASAILETLLRETGAREVLAARPGGLQSLANLGKLVRELRRLQAETTFSQVIEMLGVLDKEELAESESRIMEERSDSVRILTIHKAKGLDFPIVLAAGLGGARNPGQKSFLADPHQKKTYAVTAGSRESKLQSAGWHQLQEWDRKRENAELIRLLYVAFTRACDHLVISTHTGWRWAEHEKKWVPEWRRSRLSPIWERLKELSLTDGLVQVLDAGILDVPVEAPRPAGSPAPGDITERLRREYAEVIRLRDQTPRSRDIRAPSGFQAAADDTAAANLAETARGRAIRLGLALHEAMDALDFCRVASIAESSREAARRHNLGRSEARLLEEMVRNSYDSELMARVRRVEDSRGKVIRELPFVRPLGRPGELAPIESGKIDLLFEEEGEWVIVDYKTDVIPAEVNERRGFFSPRYSGQVQAYERALRALGLRVKSAYLLLARTGESVEIPLGLDSAPAPSPPRHNDARMEPP
jgi:ATP-dependent helicase/nuclease subunit A